VVSGAAAAPVGVGGGTMKKPAIFPASSTTTLKSTLLCSNSALTNATS
jgi:hypothetical protein